jgi:PKD repeat protein
MVKFKVCQMLNGYLYAMNLFTKILFLLCVCFLVNCTKYVEKTSTTNPTGTVSTNPGSSGTSGNGPIIITYTSTSPCAPSNEVFTFNCSGTGVPSGATFEWYFGDGGASSGATTMHAYQDGGYKKVLVKVKTSTQKDVGELTINVKAYGQLVTPIASFSYQLKNQVGTQATYEFQSNSSIANGSLSYKWDFGDGGTNNDNKTTHTYQQKTTDQTFTVKLTAFSDAGCGDSKSVDIVVPAAYNITGGFTVSQTSPCLPSKEVFTFVGPTTNVPTGAIYKWDFGDGVAGSILGNPVTKSYAYNNSYSVTLIIYYNGAEIYHVIQPIKSYGLDATPLASFSVQNISNTATTATYNFNNSSQVAGGFSNTHWAWDFNDGNTKSGALPNVDNTFSRGTTDKTYTIKMTVTANSGCAATATNTITIPKQ